MQSEDLAKAFLAVAAAMHKKREYLCELDSHSGDGDHGISMDLGWKAVSLIEAAGKTYDEYLKDCGKAFITAVGASIGPLYGTAFLRAAKYCNNKEQLSIKDLIEMFHEAVKGVEDRGKAKIGDKTLLDTLVPCDNAVTAGINQSLPLKVVLENARSEAETGMNSTADMISQIGRSSRLGERSRGELDPGAASAYILIEALVTHLLPYVSESNPNQKYNVS